MEDKILIVEDNYYDIAKKAMQELGAEYDLAKDYSQAMNLLNNNEYKAIISDVFMPQETGTNKREKGLEALNLLSNEIRGSEYKGLLEIFSNYQNREPNEKNFKQDLKQDLEKILENKLDQNFGTQNIENIKKNKENFQDYKTAFKKEQVEADVKKEIIKSINTNYDNDEYLNEVIEDFVLSYDSLTKSQELFNDKKLVNTNNLRAYNSLKKAIKEGTEDQQPLGVLIAQKAKEKDISFTLATSLYHHDDIVQPVCVYQREKIIPMLDNEDGKKEEVNFWKNAYKIVTR